MRHDMATVLIEDARTCSSERSRKWGMRVPYVPDSDYEDLPTHTGRRRRQGINSKVSYDNKSSTDVLGPLEGYLRSRVGQKWDDVYSDICSHLDRRSVTGNHVFQHLWQFVDKNCWIGEKTGKVYTDSKRGPSEPDRFYVHPWTGLLCEFPDNGRWSWWKRNKKKVPITEYKLDNGQIVMWSKGFWYFIVREEKMIWSAYLARYIKDIKETKFQLNKKELKKLGLSNTKLELA